MVLGRAKRWLFLSLYRKGLDVGAPLSPHLRLQELTARDLEKQERERSANSLEAFIFETQVCSRADRDVGGLACAVGWHGLQRG